MYRGMDGTMGANGNRVHILRGSRLRVHSPPHHCILHTPDTVIIPWDCMAVKYQGIKVIMVTYRGEGNGVSMVGYRTREYIWLQV